MVEKDKDFLSRWSRRKLETRQDRKKSETAEPQDGPPSFADNEAGETPGPLDCCRDVATENNTPGQEGESAAPNFDDVDFDALEFDSDYTRFMQDGVPETIRRRALSKLWGSNPILANLDGLNEYDEDYTDAALAVDALKSAYQVGRGYLTDEDLEKVQGEGGQSEHAGGSETADASTSEQVDVGTGDNSVPISESTGLDGSESANEQNDDQTNPSSDPGIA